jgi:Protein of unknown function (DUF3606)
VADDFRHQGAPDRSRVSMNDEQEVRYWTEALGCSEDELAAAVVRVGNSTDEVRRELNRHRGYGTFRLTTRLRQKYRHGDQDDRASDREPLASAPALSERRHRRLARRLVAVRR